METRGVKLNCTVMTSYVEYTLAYFPDQRLSSNVSMGHVKGIFVADTYMTIALKGLFTVNAFLSRVFVAVLCDTKGHIVFQCSLSQWTWLSLHCHFVAWVKCSRTPFSDAIFIVVMGNRIIFCHFLVAAHFASSSFVTKWTGLNKCY